MIPLSLASIKTKDGLALEGIIAEPKKKSSAALIWIHGLGSRFSSGQTFIHELSLQCKKHGFGYFKFNTRGHDIAARGNKKLAGAGFEKFTDCIFDIRAMVRFAKKRGYKKIILAGHSTGANKTLYYLYKTKDRSVRGIILLGPINDYAAECARKNERFVRAGLAIAEKLKKPDMLMPQQFGIYSVGRYKSLYKQGGTEDVFPYSNPRASWKELKSVKIPVAVMLGSRDEYLDRPAKKLISIFEDNTKTAKSFAGIIIKGANHGFRKKEKELAGEIVRWIKRAVV